MDGIRYLEVEGQDDSQGDNCGEEDVDNDVLLEPLNNNKVIFFIVLFLPEVLNSVRTHHTKQFLLMESQNLWFLALATSSTAAWLSFIHNNIIFYFICNQLLILISLF